MKITHHPAADSLMSCSAGSMPEAFAAVMASHISVCETCRADLALMEMIGVALFDELSPTHLERAAPVMELRRREADAEPQAQRGTGVSGGDVPEPLVPVIGRYLDDIAWRRVAPSVSIHDIALSPKATGNLRLIKVLPGKTLPLHGHKGSELTLVLRGSCRDDFGHYRAGDMSDLGEDIDHQPIADAIEGCICLVATHHKLRFKSILARLIQPVTGM